MLHLSNRLFNTPLLCLALLATTAATVTANSLEATTSEEISIPKLEIDKQFHPDIQLLDGQLLQQDLEKIDYQQQQEYQQWLRDQQRQQLQQQNLNIPPQQPQLRGF